MVSFSDWLQEAKDDLSAADNLGQAKLYAQACFHCQQAAEKALKSLLLKSKGTVPKSHSLRLLATEAGVLEQLLKELALLEGDYSLSRYPDVYGKPPRDIYGRETFLARIGAAKKVLGAVEKWTKS